MINTFYNVQWIDQAQLSAILTKFFKLSKVKIHVPALHLFIEIKPEHLLNNHFLKESIFEIGYDKSETVLYINRIKENK